MDKKREAEKMFRILKKSGIAVPSPEMQEKMSVMVEAMSMIAENPCMTTARKAAKVIVRLELGVAANLQHTLGLLGECLKVEIACAYDKLKLGRGRNRKMMMTEVVHGRSKPAR